MSQYTLGVHLQILLAVGLAVFCYCLVLGCILCCRRRKNVSSQDKEAAFLSSHPAETVTVTLTPSPCAQPVKQQYEELDGDVLEFPSFKSSSSPSEDDAAALPFDPSPTRSAELVHSAGSFFPMRRLSSPAVPCTLSKPQSHGRASLPSLTKLSLVSKSRRAMGRRSTVSSESFLYSESSRLSAAAAKAPTQQHQPSGSQYGSNSLSIHTKPAPLLHFSLLFSSACATLLVNILGLSGANRRRSGVFVRASLPPLCPSPQQIASRRRSFSPDLQSQSFVLQVGSVEELRTCTLRLAVYSRDFSGLREAVLGVVELSCEQMDWEPDITTTYTRQLTPTKSKLKKSVSSQETLGHRRSLVGVPRALGQLFILLQYQTLAQRVKVMVRKAENLAKLTRIPGAADHYVVINLRQDGKVIGTKETKGVSGPNPVWNAPFLFDLPPGDITQLPLVFEFIIMQGRLYTKSSVLGCVVIGSDAPEPGQAHWKEMCSRVVAAAFFACAKCALGTCSPLDAVADQRSAGGSPAGRLVNGRSSLSVRRGDMGQLYGATLLPFGALCVVFLWESGASSIRTTLAVDTSRAECPESKILTVEYPCVRAGGKNSTCFRRKCCEGFRFVMGQCIPESVDVCAASPCEQQCTDNFGRVVCTCYPGYRFDRERHRSHKSPYCLDIDECALSGSSECDHECVNTVGSFLCRCRSGYVLAADQRSCIPVHNLSSSGKSDTSMSAGTCSFTCQDFMNMKNSLLQLKLRLGNTQSPNQVPGLANSSDKPSLGRTGKGPDSPCLPGLPGPSGAPGVPGNVEIKCYTQYVFIFIYIYIYLKKIVFKLK
ncbi:synaptotagmin-5-like [Solea senegalensis]|uniref:Synaptotagmin-5-like n=1 Tax=Solea senegalensis TaxID=28829 RepID=A0AAV6Q4H6_SOLSE|nr:synaptotagmin-5-like [Solea senegalensis]